MRASLRDSIRCNVFWVVLKSFAGSLKDLLAFCARGFGLKLQDFRLKFGGGGVGSGFRIHDVAQGRGPLCVDESRVWRLGFTV